MGAKIDSFAQINMSFSKIEEMLKLFLNHNKNKSKNIVTLHEIGYLKEYSYIKSEKLSNEVIKFSRNYKSLKKVESVSKLKDNFKEWTKFLFDINIDDLESEQKLNQKIEFLIQKPLSKSFFQKNIKKYLFNNKSFNKLIKYGIPNNFREFIWDIVISEKYSNHKMFNYEEEQIKYKSILRNAKNNTQIEKDLNRTFNNESEQSPKHIQILRNVLNCINIYNNEYCQGMNFIVGFLLKITNFDEVQTFYIFRNIFKEIKHYFEDGFPLLKKNIAEFDKHFQNLYPKLYKHFQKNEIFNEIWIGKWFQTLFTLSLPFNELCIIWDNLIIRGFNFVIYISLAIIDSIETNLLEIKDSSDIISYLQNVLNPEKKVFIYKQQYEEFKYYFIPLNKIISKACKIEKKIKENILNNTVYKKNIDYNNINKVNLNLKTEKKEYHNDLDSICTKCTKESDNSLISKSSSSYSSNYGHINKLKSLNLANANNLNNIKINLFEKFNNNENHCKINSQNLNLQTQKNIQPKKNDNTNQIYKKPNINSATNYVSLNNSKTFNGYNNPLQNNQNNIYNNNIINDGIKYSNIYIYN